ncbi:MAG: hypothetical protein IJ112_03025 [Oscillospiraceae bacterium]|nr:hypothetical protein [Oscillospiraceae bacterium]
MQPTNQQKFIIKNALAVLFLTGMVFVSERTRQPAVLFPEILALLIGMWITPRMPWRVSRWEIPVLMTLCAVWGIVISRWLPAPTAVKMGAAFFGAACALLCVHATLLPIFSACILPILIGEQSWVYPVAVCGMTVLLCAGQTLFERVGLRAPQACPRWAWRGHEEVLRWGILIPVTTMIAAAAIALGYPCVVAPPLVVLLSELSFPDSPVAAKGARVALVTILCACVGAAARWGLQVQLGLPLWLAAFAAAAGALTILSLSRLPFPPAGALAILPMLLPKSLVVSYPLQVGAGTLLFLLVDRLIRTLL